MKLLFTSGALLGALAVALGAFGAHGLSSKLAPERLQIFETGVRYQFYHVFAILVVGLLAQYSPSAALHWSGRFFILGIVLFSGSLYLLATRDLLGIQSWSKVLGPITPLGGLLFIAGWVSLAIHFLKK